MKIFSKALLGAGIVILSILIIMTSATASVIGIKALYEHLNPVSADTADVGEFHIGDTIDDVTTFTNQVSEYTKNIGR